MLVADSERLVALDRADVEEGGFKAFVRVAWPMVEPRALVWEPHMDLVCDHLEAVLLGEIRDLVINVPPGTSKSNLCSVLFPAYAWIKDPALKFLYTTYDEQLSHRFAKRTMDLINTDWWKRRWPHVEIVDGDRANQSLYDTTAGGMRASTMMGGRATGKHADILMCDDPHKPDDLEGEPESVKKTLEEAWDSRWINTFSNRRADAATFRRVVIMQRLHEQDIAGRMVELPTTVHLCLPMEYEPNRHCKTAWGQDWRTVEGELLCPLRFPQEVVEADRKNMTARAFASQMQQRPAPKEGNTLKRDYFENRWLLLPPYIKMYVSVDCNLKERADTDRAIVQVWGVLGAQVYCIDQVGGRWSFDMILKGIRDMKLKWPMVRNILIEAKANGPAVVQVLKKTIPGVLEIEPQGGKSARVDAVEPTLSALDVLFPAHNAPWVQALIEEAVTFPSAAHDDMLDAMTQFLVWHLTSGVGIAAWRKAMRNARNGHTFR
jgi:predicted phage terminase large subunit-like protein